MNPMGDIENPLTDAIPERKPAVLYITMGGKFRQQPNGGSIYYHNLLRKLMAEGINVRVAAINIDKGNINPSDIFALPLENIHVINLKDRKPTFWDKLRLFPPIPWAKEAYAQKHIFSVIKKLVSYYKIDAVLVTYLYTALFVPQLSSLSVKKILMVINRESEFYLEQIKHQKNKPHWLISRLAAFKINWLEKKTCKAFDKVVAIGAPDIPPYLPDSKVAVIPCFLEESKQRWQYKEGKVIFFVGAYGHHPNKIAVEYLLDKIIPKLFAAEPDLVFFILGAESGQVKSAYRHPNLIFLGKGTPEIARELFLNANLMLAPIENTHGQKMKIAEAIAYGTPFLASAQTMLGYPYLSDLPYAPLEKTDKSVEFILELVNSREKLMQLSIETKVRHRAFIQTQKDVWTRLLTS